MTKPVNYHDDEGLYDAKLAKVGQNGPLDVAHAALVPELKPFRDALSQAWVSKGEPLSEDIYSGTMHGLTHCMETIYRGIRSTSGSFLKGKPNITILASTYSKKINFDGTTATSVSVLVNGTTEVTFKANYEIIVSQGVYETPKLLMLSGIGPEKELAAHNITPVVISEHVGQNLLDHPIMPYVRKLKDGIGAEDHIIRPGPARNAAISRYNKDKTGPIASGLLELVGFPRIDKYLETSKEYVEYKKKNGGVDPFGPGGQPHFEIDFVVSSLLSRYTLSSHYKLTFTDILIANVFRRLPMAHSHTCFWLLHDRYRRPPTPALAERLRQTELNRPARTALHQHQLLL